MGVADRYVWISPLFFVIDKISPEKIQSIHSDISHMSQLELLEISKPITYDL